MDTTTSTPPVASSAGFGWFYRRTKYEPDHVIALCAGHAYLAGQGWQSGSGDMPDLPPADKCCVCMGTATIRRMINAPLKPNGMDEGLRTPASEPKTNAL